MVLQELVLQNKKDRKRIEEEFKILEAFQKNNPWHVLEVLKQLEEGGEQRVPSFEEVISINEEYILDTLSKVFSQIKRHNPLLLTKDTVGKIYFYSITQNLYSSQLKSGLGLGDKDKKGRLVTGSNLTIEIASVNVKEFLEMYYTINN